MSDTPTPRTLAAVIASKGQWTQELRQCSEQLERELAELRATTMDVDLVALREELNRLRELNTAANERIRRLEEALEAVAVIAPRIVRAIPEYAHEMKLVAQAKEAKP